MVRHIPFSVIASWPTPNYVDPVRRGPAAVNVTIVFMTLVSIAVFLRLYVHVYITRWFGPGDIFIILAYLSTIAMTALEVVGYERYDWGRHIWDVPINNFSRSIYISWWYRIVYSDAACFTRMALIFFYYRITQGNSAMRVFRRWIHLTAVFSALVGLALVFATIFQCSPIRAMWTWPPIEGARCINEGMWTFVCGIINTIADIFVVVLPIPIIYKLRLPMRKRIGAILLVSLGFLVCIVGVVRAYFVWLSLIHSYDVTWLGYGALVAATVEIHVGLVCACAPAIRLGIIKFIKPKLQTLRSSMPSKMSGTKLSTGISPKASFRPSKPQKLFTPNSGTFLASATRISSDDEREYELESKAMTHVLRTIEDDLNDDTFHGKRPRPPTKDDIYLTREVKVEYNPASRLTERDNGLQRWTSTDTAVEYADATVFARRSDVAHYSHIVKQDAVSRISSQSDVDSATEPPSDLECIQAHDLPPSPSRIRHFQTLQIPERTFRFTSERFSAI